MKKKIIALLLTSAMIVSAFVGCGQQQKEESKATESSAVVSQGSEKEEEKAPELTTVKVLAYNLDWGGAQSKDWESTFTGKYFKEQLAKAGVELDIEFVAQDDFSKILNTRMASQVDMPDLICNPWGDTATMKEWGEKGLIYSVNDLLEEYDKDGSIRAFYDTVPGAWELSTLDDGTTYWFSTINNNQDIVNADDGKVTPWYSSKYLLLRKDWVEAVGEEWKFSYTPDELFSLLKKMQDKDVNGNGKADEVVCVSINNFHNGVALGYGLNSKTTGGYIQGQDVVYNNFEHENFQAYVEFMQKLYKEGLYDTEALSISRNEMVAQNRVAMTFDYFWMGFSDVLTEECNYQPVILDLDGDSSNGYYSQIDYYGPQVTHGWIVPTKSENVEGVMKFMDYIYSEEYALLSQFGVEGYGYERNADGSIKDIGNQNEDEGKSLDDIRIAQHVFPALWTAKTEQAIFTADPEKNPKVVEREVFKHKDMMEYFNYNLENEHVVIAGTMYALPTEEEQAVISEYSATLTTYCSELITDLILGRKSLDDLDTYINEMNKLGMADYLAVRQAQRDRATGK